MSNKIDGISLGQASNPWIYISKIREDCDISSKLEQISQDDNGIAISRSLGSVDCSCKVRFNYSEEPNKDAKFKMGAYLVERTIEQIGVISRNQMMLFSKKENRNVDENGEESEGESEKTRERVFVVSFDKQTQKIVRNYVDPDFSFNVAHEKILQLGLECINNIKAVSLASSRTSSETFNNSKGISEVELFCSWCTKLKFDSLEKINVTVSRHFIALPHEKVNIFEKLYCGIEEKKVLKNIVTCLHVLEYDSDFVKERWNDKIPFLDKVKRISDEETIMQLERQLGTEHEKINDVEEVNWNGKTYFKVNNLWLIYNANFFKVLNEEFEKVITLIKKPPEYFGLDPYWEGKKSTDAEKRKSEKDYNNEYLKKKGFLVGDNAKSAQIFELFDILKAENEKDKNILFHVKIGLAGNTRDVCSQIYNSAQALTSVRISNNSYVPYTNGGKYIFDTFLTYKDMQKQWDQMSKEYPDQSFENFMKKKFEFVFVCLWENQKPFSADSVTSNIAKLSLVRLKHQMDTKLNVPLHFCLIEKQNNRQ